MPRIPEVDTADNRLERDVIGGKGDTAVQASATTKSLAAYAKGIIDALAGANGVVTFPDAAVPANGVSIAEALRYNVENQNYRLVSNAVTLGTAGATNIFDVTGGVEAIVVGLVTTAVSKSAGAVTLEVGTADSTAAVIAQLTDADDLAEDDVYAGNASHDVAALPSAKVLNETTIIQTTGANCSAGEITYYCFWKPITSDGNVAAASS